MRDTRFFAFLLHENLIRKIARQFFPGDESAIDEAVQVTSVKFLTLQGKFDPSRDCGSYLGKVVRNYCLDQKSKRIREAAVDVSRLSEVEDPYSSVESFEDDEHLHYLLDMLKTARDEGDLTEEDYAIFYDRSINNMPFDKIAESYKLTSRVHYQARYAAGQRRIRQIIAKVQRVCSLPGNRKGEGTVNKHFFSPSVCELAFVDYITLLEEDPNEARTRLEDLLVDAEALGYYLRILNCSADDTEPTPRCNISRDLRREILVNGLRNISVDILLALARDREALSDLQCRVLEIDEPESFWGRKQGTGAFLNVVDSGVSADAGETDRTTELDFFRATSSLGFVYLGNVGASSEGVASSFTRTCAAEVTCSITASGILETQTTIAAGSEPDVLESQPTSRWAGHFSLESVEDVSRIEEHLRKRLSRWAAGDVSSRCTEEVILATISEVWAFLLTRDVKSVSSRELDNILHGVYARILKRTTRSPDRLHQEVEGDNRSRTGDGPVAFGDRPKISELEKSVLVRRFVQYKPVHQIARELGLNSYLVKEICERTRKQVMDSLNARGAQDAMTNVWSTLITGAAVTGGATQNATSPTSMRKRSFLSRTKDCLFWLLLGAIVTALMAALGPIEMRGAVLTLIGTYALVSIMTPSSQGSEQIPAPDGSSFPSPCG